MRRTGLDLNAAIVASQKARGAPGSAIARTRFNDYASLIRVGRLDDALRLLLECRQIFQDAGDVDALARILTALADLEDKQGHGEAAISFEQDALRYKYSRPDPTEIAVSHYNLGNYLHRHARQANTAFTHHVAAALLFAITGSARLDEALRNAGTDLRVLGDAALPADTARLCDRVAEVPRTDLARLLTALTPATGGAEQAYQEVITRVRAAAAEPPLTTSAYLAAWDPVIAALVAAHADDSQARAALDAELGRYSDYACGSDLPRYDDSRRWTALIAVLSRIRDGDAAPAPSKGSMRRAPPSWPALSPPWPARSPSRPNCGLPSR